MTDKEKMLWMFERVHGEITGACYVEVHEGEDDPEVLTLHLMKHGKSCWTKTKAELVFDFITLHLDIL
jgi:hypothetical protein